MRELLILILSATTCFAQSGADLPFLLGPNNGFGPAMFPTAQVFLTSDSGVQTTGGAPAAEGQTAVTWINQVPTVNGDCTLGTGTYHTVGPNGQPYITIVNANWSSRAQNASTTYLINTPFTTFLVARIASYNVSVQNQIFFNGLNNQVGIWNDNFFAGGTFGLTSAFFDSVSANTTIKAGTSATGANSGVALNSWYLMTTIASNTPNTYVAWRTNSVEVGHASPSVNVSGFNWEWIGANSSTIDFAAVIVVPTNYSSSVLASYEALLKSRYGIP